MRRSTIAAAASAALGAAGLGAVLASRRLRPRSAEKVRHFSADKLTFTEALPGVEKAILWGDETKGPYGAFTRFKPGLKIPLHSHPNDIVVVVLSGAYLFGTSEGETRVAARSYFFLPGGTPHMAGSDPEEGCFFYEESPGAFDVKLLE
ncbi:MAG: cupin domain-containing protein [Deltaproteobacteria bacterium]|nr:cupin domain-containing protein [Deltaproteobacteria bacterium]